MENTKSVKSINKKNQIVKLNKRKIIIISFIVFVLIAGLSVGLFFAFRPEKLPLVRNDHTHWVDVDEAKTEARKSNGDDEDPIVTGVYFGVQNSDLANLALYGDSYLDESAKDDLAGPFSEYLKENNNMEWYCVNAANEEENRLNMEQFFHDGEENKEWAVHDGWDSVWWGGEASNSSVQLTSQGNNWVGADISYGPETSDTTSTDGTTTSTDTDDNDYQLMFNGTGQTITIDYTSPTWLWFRNGELYAMSNGIIHNSDEETGAITLPGEGLEDGVSTYYWDQMYDYTYNLGISQKP